ncbi:MAG TPA: hypothetical protein VFW39_02790 [Sphingomicrobium sp.]|nr:hypothetical protein [Sphingomicrobium sp.]
MADNVPYWWPKGSNKWGFNPHKALKPQLIASAAQMAFIFGGFLLALYAIPRWPALAEDRVLVIIATACMTFGFAASFVVIPGHTLPPRLPLIMTILYRLGLGLSFTAWVTAIALIANGYGTPIFIRDVPIVAKHHSLGDPSRWEYMVSARPWPGSQRVVDIEVTGSVYDRLEAPVTAIHASQAELEAMRDVAQVRLVLGRGRLGFDWLKSAGLPDGQQ